MSELDILIHRLMTQRASIERATNLVTMLDGPAILLDLGDGTALDHPSEVARKRGVMVFDKGPIADGADVLSEIALDLPGREALPPPDGVREG